MEVSDRMETRLVRGREGSCYHPLYDTGSSQTNS